MPKDCKNKKQNKQKRKWVRLPKDVRGPPEYLAGLVGGGFVMYETNLLRLRELATLSNVKNTEQILQIKEKDKSLETEPNEM